MTCQVYSFRNSSMHLPLQPMFSPGVVQAVPSHGAPELCCSKPLCLLHETIIKSRLTSLIFIFRRRFDLGKRIQGGTHQLECPGHWKRRTGVVVLQPPSSPSYGRSHRHSSHRHGILSSIYEENGGAKRPKSHKKQHNGPQAAEFSRVGLFSLFPLASFSLCSHRRNRATHTPHPPPFFFPPLSRSGLHRRPSLHRGHARR